MSANQVYMDVPGVRDMAKQFGEIGQFLTNVVKVLDTLSNLLKSTAFIGAVGGTAVLQFIDVIKPYIDKVSQKCEELNTDLTTSVDAYERGDEEGSTRFH